MLTTALGYGVKEDGEMEEEECRNEVKLKWSTPFLGFARKFLTLLSI